MDSRFNGRPLRLSSLVPVLAAGLTVGACTPHVEVVRDRGPQAYYQTASPFENTSDALERSFTSVKRIQSSAVYRTYLFIREDAPTEAEVGSPQVLERAVDTVTTLRERAATAVVIARVGRRRVLVTVDHAIHFPDVLLRYFEDDPPVAGAGSNEPRQIESISILTSQTNWVLDPPGLDTFEVLARDERADLALIGMRFPDGEASPESPVLGVPIGDPGRLSWGSFVYVLGYPRGYPMVTRGIVSSPHDPIVASFLVDGLWNPGMSGGPILAVRGDGEGLEWVGMARAAAGAMEARIVPEARALERHDLRLPYEGPLFLEEFRRVEYGITLSVPMDQIRRFVNESRVQAAAQGYDLPPF